MSKNQYKPTEVWPGTILKIDQNSMIVEVLVDTPLGSIFKKAHFSSVERRYFKKMKTADSVRVIGYAGDPSKDGLEIVRITEPT